MNDEFEERAAIIEFLGNVSREDSERLARFQLGLQAERSSEEVDDGSDFL